MSSGENEQTGGIGRLLAGRYRIQEQLGRGGMGVVWRAVDESLGREVAIKELRTFTDAAAPELAALRLRMQREGRAAARVRHPGVIAVHDVAEVDGRPLIIMELVDGPSLDDVLRERGTLPPREAAAIGAKVMDALAAAHQAGVLHRDVKPGNILLEHSGRVVLTDFGIAAMDDPGDGASVNLTRSGELVGSLDYLAPERAQGHEPGPASDIWALGATLHFAVEGSPPFRRTSTWTTLTAIISDPLPEPVRAGALAPVLGALMEKNPYARPDADRAKQLLEEVATGAAGSGSETMALRPAPRTAPPVPSFANPAPVPTPDTETPLVAHDGPLVGTAQTQNLRHRRRTFVVAAAVAAVLAAGGVGYALLSGPGGSGPEARRGQSPGAGGGDTPEPESGKATKGPTPSEQGKSGKPSEASKEPTKGGDEKPSGGASKPAGDGGTTTGGGSNGGSDSGGSDGGGTSGGSDGGTTTTGGNSGGSGGGSTPDPVCHSIGGGKYNCDVWKTSKSYTASGAEAGTLNAGTNYFYCQQNLGRRETYGQWTNVWWAKTDDDSGNTNVFISDVYIKGGDNDQPLPGLPVC